MALRLPEIALRCLVLDQYGVRKRTVDSIPWVSKAVNSLSMSENRGGHLRSPLPVDGQ